MIENGLYNFYRSFANFVENLITDQFDKKHDDDDVAALTMEQLKIPLIIYFILSLLALVLLAIEIIIQRINNQR